MKRSENLSELTKALVKAQSQMVGAKADSTNPFYKSTYADLASVWDAVRGPLTKNGLAIVQTTEDCGTGVTLETTMLHESGEWCSSVMFMGYDKISPQDLGKLVTYLRRYSLAAITGVAQIDDDAQSIMDKMKVDKVEKTKVDKGTAPVNSPNGEHEHAWRKSKFNDTEEYCATCKSKRSL